MKIEKIHVKNFRLLKDIEMDLEDQLSLVIGKNNTGKTSFLCVLQKFLLDKNIKFSLEDFNVEVQSKIIKMLESEENQPEEVSISLKLTISYDADDNIGRVAFLILDLDENNNHLVISFKYKMSIENSKRMINDYKEYKEELEKTKRGPEYYISRNLDKFFEVEILAMEYGNEDKNFQKIERAQARQIIAMDIINAKRDVNNEQGKSRTLSILAEQYYNSHQPDAGLGFPGLQEQLGITDEKLTQIYENIFKDIIDEISMMSYSPKEAKLAFISTLNDKSLFQDNTVVKYDHGGTLMPEDYNGLGYLNLINIIFSIRVKLEALAKCNQKNGVMAPLNILFIEEPEAHTHPQMQYIFIHNIQNILDNFYENHPGFRLQTIISTHSPHIVSQCQFEWVKFLVRTEDSVKVKNLKDFKLSRASTDGTEDALRFLYRYITINYAELFFADKAIIVEGDTERILMPTMMGKIDKEVDHDKTEHLLSQNITIMQVGGAYAHIFVDIMEFLEIKVLIITDIDYCDKNGKACKYNEAASTSNAVIKHFTNKKSLSQIVALKDEEKIFSYDRGSREWVSNKEGNLKLAFQTEANNYHPRSFEDSFLCENRDFFLKNYTRFKGIKNADRIKICNSADYYEIAKQCIGNKADFAMDLLFYDGDDDEADTWTAPTYIMKGLQWLAQ